METTPSRLRRFAPKQAMQFGRAVPQPGPEAQRLQVGRRLTRRGRAIRRGVSILAWTALAIPIQAVCLALPGTAKMKFAQIYWASFARLMGLRVRVIGQRARPADGRPVIFVSNHSSWLDIPVLGGQLDACFIAKDDVAKWPVVRTIARLGRSVFVSRSRGSTGRERDSMVDRLAEGDNLILFPEGTTSDGSRVLPFRSAFFAIADASARPILQPISVVYDRLAGLPTGRACRPLFSWYGDMDIASHFWQLAQHKGLRGTMLLHTPLDPAHFANRKDLANAVWRACADGAATLRQNRPAVPILTRTPNFPADASEPAYI
jgi:1-acyl-sn-glycerol-3-phosphate acyltransferase